MTKRKQGDEDSDYQEDEFNEESFGLPDIDYKPLDTQEDYSLREDEGEATNEDDLRWEARLQREEEEKKDDENTENAPPVEPKAAYTSTSDDDDDNERSGFLWLWIIILILLLGGALYLGYIYIYVPRQERLQVEEADRIREEEARRATENAAAENAATGNTATGSAATGKSSATTSSAETQKDPITSKQGGSIETVGSRTGRYYVVIASSIDGDLVMDYAKKLKRRKMDLRIIKPYGRVMFTRLTIADFAQLSEARDILGNARQQFGENVWVLRY